jgi:hypothetical protein
MIMSKWGVEPLQEAYSRVSNPERFKPLHRLALNLLDELEKEYEVNRTEGYGLEKEFDGLILSRKPIRLEPVDTEAAPINIGLTTFPGVGLRVGHFYRELFPFCGCDACGEDVERESEKLSQIVKNVTEGRFRETVIIPIAGDARYSAEHWSNHERYGLREGKIQRSLARRIMKRSRHFTFNWKPWSKLPGDSQRL